LSGLSKARTRSGHAAPTGMKCVSRWPDWQGLAVHLSTRCAFQRLRGRGQGHQWLCIRVRGTRSRRAGFFTIGPRYITWTRSTDGCATLFSVWLRHIAMAVAFLIEVTQQFTIAPEWKTPAHNGFSQQASGRCGSARGNDLHVGLIAKKLVRMRAP